jgi:hypothetical protein
MQTPQGWMSWNIGKQRTDQPFIFNDNINYKYAYCLEDLHTCTEAECPECLPQALPCIGRI